MKDRRLTVFRTALEGLMQSLDAFVRVSRWTEADPPPEPLRLAASQLLERMGVAERLAAGTFHGSVVEVDRVGIMCSAMRKLDAAYIKYRRRTASAADRADEAILTLEAEIGEARASAGY